MLGLPLLLRTVAKAGPRVNEDAMTEKRLRVVNTNALAQFLAMCSCQSINKVGHVSTHVSIVNLRLRYVAYASPLRQTRGFTHWGKAVFFIWSGVHWKQYRSKRLMNGFAAAQM